MIQPEFSFHTVIEDEFWTAKQRDGHSLHEISYRACYKPQLPAFFIDRYCPPGGTVYDPFMGRGTTLVEGKLHGRHVAGNDINPVSGVFTEPRLHPVDQAAVRERVDAIDLPNAEIEDESLLVFFAPETLRELYGWRAYFRERQARAEFDTIDAWLRMVACNRLTGHSKGFFSVYTLPPNQATSVKAQRRINANRNQTPEYRDTRNLILRKSKSLLRDPLPHGFGSTTHRILHRPADDTPEIPDDSVDLVVTSPPFLAVVDYATDNWLRNWFCDLTLERSDLWNLSNLDSWTARMRDTLAEQRRLLRPGGWVAFEVGEVNKGKVNLDESIVQTGRAVGLRPDSVLINRQQFTKTANCWGVANNKGGTNTNRIVVFQKPR